MELGAKIAVDSSRSRVPLIEQANVPPPPTPVKQVRRKRSFVLRIDSSEECPSPHESLYEAFYFSNNNSDDSGGRVEAWTMVGLRKANPLDTSAAIDQNSTQASTNGPMAGSRPMITTEENHSNQMNESAISTIDDVQFLYGNGTVLETIAEQKSNGTMRSLFRPKSVENMHKVCIVSEA